MTNGNSSPDDGLPQTQGRYGLLMALIAACSAAPPEAAHVWWIVVVVTVLVMWPKPRRCSG
ncbi:hypothetical protein V1J52_04180 [Streptomyces sp. TRM 70351]|uniref:hypothetical protein n=1 Tax=Streptomyces sp. TRM 70351 TaxID=3116552 RepID=UPI002E7B09C0|nr:hypothetical protein [Streptomyces sp. TRM 70351]MEE1927388.1 hypothetical protein [Streptomyces sp. TRM 70351]